LRKRKYEQIQNGKELVLRPRSEPSNPDEAADFVERTQVDALAVAIGTSHGAYKFTRKPTGEILAISRIEEIHNRLPNTHLVMHGSSSVPEDLLALINEFGGAIPDDQPYRYPGTIHSNVGMALVLPGYKIFTTYQGSYDPQ
jgi:hypothetical protein